MRATHACCLITGLLLSSASGAEGLVTAGATEQKTTEADGERVDASGDIVVMARKRAERLQDVPVALTALNGALLEEQKTQTLQDLRGNAPNIVIEQAGGQEGAAALYIRGIGSQELELSVDPAVGLVIDGVYLANSIGMIPYTFDFDQVEVLRGPQGTLFGKNTTGGVINIKRKGPSFVPTGEFELTAGRYGRREVKGAVSGPVIDGVLAARLAVGKVDDDGFKYDLTQRRRAGFRDFFDITPSLLFTPTERLQFLLRYEYQRNRSDGPAAQNLSGTGNAVNPAGELPCTLFRFCGPFGDGRDIDVVAHDFPERFRYDLHAATAQADWDVGIGTITNVFGYRTFDFLTASDVDQTPAPIFVAIRDQTFRQYSNELRFASSFSDRVDFVIGGFFFQDRYTNFQRTVSDLPLFGPFPIGTEAQLRQRQARTTWAGFGELNVKLTSKLTLTAGGRYTTERKSFVGRSFLSIPGVGVLPVSQAPGARRWSDFSPKAGLSWKPEAELLLYYTFSRGFRSGGFNGRNATPESIGPYQPERVEQHEIGIKSDLFDRQLRFNAAAFSINYDNKQEDAIQSDPLLGSVTVIANASAARLRGLELETSFTPRALPGFVLNLNAGYLDAKYRSFCADLDGPLLTNPALPTCAAPIPVSTGGALVPTDNSNLRLRRTPRWQLGVNARYSLAVGQVRPTFWSRLSYTDPYFTDLRNDPRSLYRREAIVDLGLDVQMPWDASNVRASIFVRNLTNRQQITNVAVVPGLVAFGSPTIGRTWGVELAGKF